jgi:hypothetical protein
MIYGFALLLLCVNTACSSDDDHGSSSVYTLQKSDLQANFLKEGYDVSTAKYFYNTPRTLDKDYCDYLYSHVSSPDFEPSWVYEDPNWKDTPFYANNNKNNTSHMYPVVFFKGMFAQSPGNFALTIVIGGELEPCVIEYWLATYSFDGKLIDYLPALCKYCPIPISEEYYTMESQVKDDFSIDVQQINFPQNDSLMVCENNSYKLISPLVGQRVDKSYKLTSDGHFVKESETKYKTQDYLSNGLKGYIRNGYEKKE